MWALSCNAPQNSQCSSVNLSKVYQARQQTLPWKHALQCGLRAPGRQVLVPPQCRSCSATAGQMRDAPAAALPCPHAGRFPCRPPKERSVRTPAQSNWGCRLKNSRRQPLLTWSREALMRLRNHEDCLTHGCPYSSSYTQRSLADLGKALLSCTL